MLSTRFDPVAWQVLERLERGDGDAEIAVRLAPLYGADAVKGALSGNTAAPAGRPAFSDARKAERRTGRGESALPVCRGQLQPALPLLFL